MSSSDMRSFWDRRAAEDPFYFVDNRLRYRRPDRSLFWSRGVRELNALLGSLGVEVTGRDDIVEIGCGIGRLTRAIASNARTVRALDVSPRMIELAREYSGDQPNIEWLVGDGITLAPIADASADGCISHVVFQHIPDPQITLGYISEMGRILRPRGWSAFQISNDEIIHRRRPLAQRLLSWLLATLRRGPGGQAHPAWLGSAVNLADVARTADGAGLALERVVGEGTQYCQVLLRKRP
jgi:SAM-dependent methyltransferase